MDTRLFTPEYDAAGDTDATRRDFVQLAGKGLAAFGIWSIAAPTPARAGIKGRNPPEGADNFYTSDQVNARKVRFTNQYRMAVVGNLFLPKGLDRKSRHPAIVVG